MCIMLSELISNGVISDDLGKRLDQVRYWTYAAEWGRGDAPSEKVQMYVFSHAPGALSELRMLVKKFRGGNVNYDQNLIPEARICTE